jgi:hypothetical protein
MFRKLITGNTRGGWLFPSCYLFCWAHLAIQERWIQHLRQKVPRFGLFEPYIADPPSESNQSYCFLVFAIDRTYSTKQKTNWLELYELIGTCMAYLAFSNLTHEHSALAIWHMQKNDLTCCMNICVGGNLTSMKWYWKHISFCLKKNYCFRIFCS